MFVIGCYIFFASSIIYCFIKMYVAKM